ncbi:hypothetical protein [Stackebrandtia soli]|uniref:hypothetical protein n=1 Tax=Stackebrandtia soli TaxID=1892856 RepID=UPI0039EBED3C
MHAYPAQMRTIGGALKTIAGDVGTNVTDARADAEVAGTGNEGLATVATAADTAETWLAHVKSIKTALTNSGDGLITSANEIEGTDLDSSIHLADTSPQ